MTISLTTPANYQVFQRSGNVSDILISGSITNALVAHDIEASFNGGAYSVIATGVTGSFSGTLSSQAEGQGTLTVRVVSSAYANATVSYVGIGDVVGIIGQSNASGRATNTQVYSHASLKAVMFGNDYVWKELSDPTDSVAGQLDRVSLDTSVGGSPWPLVATSWMASQSVPVAFVPCAMGGSGIGEWLPGLDHANRSTLYGSSKYRLSITGCKLLVWHQGEANAAGTSRADYNSALDLLANALQSDLSAKIMPCKLQDLSAWGVGVDESTINLAIGDAWADNANVLVGPDLSDLTPSSGGVHFATNAEMSTVAGRWWDAIKLAFSW